MRATVTGTGQPRAIEDKAESRKAENTSPVAAK